jgi:hypothetical protein
MDVLFLNCPVFEIPSSHRVGAIVHDGAADLRLWPGPGPDRDLNAAYGPGLSRALQTERTQLGVSKLEPADVARVHPGRLHCDFLAWVAVRKPEPGSTQEPAPPKELLERAVMQALEFVAARSVVKVAFHALGDGPESLPPDERLAVIVHTAHRYEDQCFAAGRAPVVEEVLVCEPRSSVLAAAKRRVATLAKSAVPARPAAEPAAPKKRRATKSATTTGGRRSRKPPPPSLAPSDVAAMRARAAPYDRTHTYASGDWLIHSKFGVGRVESVHPDLKIDLLFEDGSSKTLIHGRV